MLPLERPDRIQIAFDDHRLVANAGLILPVTLAQRLGLSQLVDRHVDLGCARAAPTPLGAPPTSCGRRWVGSATLGPPDHSPCGPTAASMPTPWSPSAAIRTSASQSPSASTRACAARSTPYPRRTGRPSHIGWRAPLTWPRPRMYPSRASPTPQPCGSSYAGSSPRPAPNWRCSPTTAITLSSPTGTEIPCTSRPTIAATPRSRTPSATPHQVRGRL